MGKCKRGISEVFYEMNNKKFEFLEHTSEVKFKVYGKNPEELFCNCALAVSSIFSRGNNIKDKIKKEFSISAKDYEGLLYKFIDELIYLFDADNFVVARVEIKIEKTDLIKADLIVYGDDTTNYSNLDSIKSPTYAEMYVKEVKAKEWVAQVVVDV